ncbi:MAG: tyrosine-type recombinase/integrase [Nocardioides sp.]
MNSKRPRIPGVTVWQRGRKWAYWLEDDPDPLTGRRVRTGYRGGFVTYEEALAAAVTAKADRDAGKPRDQRLRVSAFFAEWTETVLPTLKPTTQAGYREVIDKYILPTLGDRWLADLTAPVLNRFYAHLLAEGRVGGDGNQRMYAYWCQHLDERAGLGPTPKRIADECDTSHAAAKAAVLRYRRGRVPTEYQPGLSAKSVQNVHAVLRVALKDAVGWGYLALNHALHAAVPRGVRREARREARGERKQVWTVEQLGAWLAVALRDRYAGLWVLAATTGMRRSELVRRTIEDIDLTERTLSVLATEVVAAGTAVESDGKTEAGRRYIALDTFTCASLERHVAMLDEEREAHGATYPTHGRLLVNEEGRPLYPDTVTKRFNRLVDRAGVPQIRLHDVRHTYATLAMDSGAVVKILADRIGHGDSAVTRRIYGHRSTGHDRELADALGALIAASIPPSEVPEA